MTNEIKLIEAFPRNLNLMDLNHSASNQTHRLNVLFAYRYWINTQRPKEIVDVPRPVAQPQVPVVDNRPVTPKNVTFTGQYNPGTTTEDMAFGVGQLSG